MSSPPRLIFRVSLLNRCCSNKPSFVYASHPLEPKSYVVGFRNHELLNELIPYMSPSESIRMETKQNIGFLLGSLNHTRLILPKSKQKVVHPYCTVPMDLSDIVTLSSKMVFGLDLIEETSTEWQMDGLFIELS